MNTSTQQRARNLSQQYLNSIPTVDNSSIGGIFEWLERMGNLANQRQDTRYDRQLNDRRTFAERAAQVQEAYQRREISGQNIRAGLAAGAQVASAEASAAPGLYNARSQRIGAIGEVSRAGASEFAKSLIQPSYTPNIARIDEEDFRNQSRALADEAFGPRGASGSRGGGNFAGSSSTSYGMNAAPPSGMRMGMYSSTYDPSIRANWMSGQNLVAINNRRLSEANAAGDILLERQRAATQRSVIDAQGARDLALQRNQQGFQRGESAAERASRERLANIEANARVQSSMFSAFSNNSGINNYQYWGGRV